MKAYTDLEQSKKLAEILPIESADMLILNNVGRSGNVDGTNCHTILKENLNPLAEVPEILPCWSLSALLGLMPFQIIENKQRYGFYQWKGFNSQGETYCFEYKSNIGERLYETIHWNNPIDAAFQMICWLKENGKI